MTIMAILTITTIMTIVTIMMTARRPVAFDWHWLKVTRDGHGKGVAFGWYWLEVTRASDPRIYSGC